MRLERFIRKSLGLKAHTVVKVEELPEGGLVAPVERLPNRPLSCGACGQATGAVAATRRPVRRWRDLSCRDQPLWLVYAPHRVRCRTCGLREPHAVFFQKHPASWITASTSSAPGAGGEAT